MPSARYMTYHPFDARPVDHDRSRASRHPPLQTGAWSPEEDEKLARFQKEFGNKWSVVAVYIPGRCAGGHAGPPRAPPGGCPGAALFPAGQWPDRRAARLGTP